MAKNDNIRVGLKGQKNLSIGGDYCSFENGNSVAGSVIDLFNPMDYPEEQRALIEEFNRRATQANMRYHLAHHREDMLANGFEAGMYIATFDREGYGKDCVKQYNESEPGFYDIILMDIQMPNLNGYDAARQIRALGDKRKASIPIVAMTANAFDEDRRAAFNAGMNGHLAKPIDVQEIRKMLSGMI